MGSYGSAYRTSDARITYKRSKAHGTTIAANVGASLIAEDEKKTELSPDNKVSKAVR